MEKVYTLTVNIEQKGTTHREKDEKTGELINPTSSAFGHMWYKIDGEEKPFEFGFGKENGFTKEGLKINNDGEAYEGNPAYSITAKITKEHYDKLLEYGKYEKISPFDESNYNVLSNSCIDYVYGALNYAGIEKKGFEGKLVPMSNVNEIQKIFRETFEDHILRESIYGFITKQTPQDKIQAYFSKNDLEKDSVAALKQETIATFSQLQENNTQSFEKHQPLNDEEIEKVRQYMHNHNYEETKQFIVQQLENQNRQENKEQDLKEKVLEEPKEESQNSVVYRR